MNVLIFIWIILLYLQFNSEWLLTIDIEPLMERKKRSCEISENLVLSFMGTLIEALFECPTNLQGGDKKRRRYGNYDYIVFAIKLKAKNPTVREGPLPMAKYSSFLVDDKEIPSSHQQYLPE